MIVSFEEIPVFHMLCKDIRIDVVIPASWFNLSLIRKFAFLMKTQTAVTAEADKRIVLAKILCDLCIFEAVKWIYKQWRLLTSKWNCESLFSSDCEFYFLQSIFSTIFRLSQILGNSLDYPELTKRSVEVESINERSGRSPSLGAHIASHLGFPVERRRISPGMLYRKYALNERPFWIKQNEFFPIFI